MCALGLWQAAAQWREGPALHRRAEDLRDLWRGAQQAFNLGEYGRAAGLLERAIASGMDDDPGAHYFRGLVREALGERDEARRSFRRAMEAHPTDPAMRVDIYRRLAAAGSGPMSEVKKHPARSRGMPSEEF